MLIDNNTSTVVVAAQMGGVPMVKRVESRLRCCFVMQVILLIFTNVSTEEHSVSYPYLKLGRRLILIVYRRKVFWTFGL
jgi:hypothetical protein